MDGSGRDRCTAFFSDLIRCTVIEDKISSFGFCVCETPLKSLINLLHDLLQAIVRAVSRSCSVSSWSQPRPSLLASLLRFKELAVYTVESSGL